MLVGDTSGTLNVTSLKSNTKSLSNVESVLLSSKLPSTVCSRVLIIWFSTVEMLEISTRASSKVLFSFCDLITNVVSFVLSVSIVNWLWIDSSISDEKLLTV